MPEDVRMRRLRWLCRRGMKELDVLLEAFLANEEANLRAGDWPELEALLNEEDDRIWHWVQHPDRCTGYTELIHAIARRA